VRTPQPTDESGFTLVEVLMAAFVLVVGMLATFTLIDGANATVSANAARTGGTNLARELIEYARGTDYGRLTADSVDDALRERSKLSGGGADPWVLERRGVKYTIAASACTFDDPKDGLAATAPSGACPAAAAVAGAPATDMNPDDFRKVTFTLTWDVRGVPGKATQSALIVNPAGGLGPQIEAFDDQASQITGNLVQWGTLPKPRLVSQNAAGVRWTVDDGVSQGDAAGGPTSWSIDWNLGTRPVNPTTFDGSWVLDGSYTVQAQAKDSRGIPGEPEAAVVHVNRGHPGSPGGFAGGYNARFDVVDMHWQRYPERDVRGYRVTRVSDGAVVCPADGSAYTTATSCTDHDPNGPADDQYEVAAVDCLNLAVTPCSYRYSANTSSITTPLVALPAPDAPTGVTCTVTDGVPTLDWDTPGANILFHRIYRDTGTDFDDRYDETITTAPHYEDPNPGTLTTQHQYWVTAVDAGFNESAPSAPCTTA
jgi:type II secretory pathway pseudopilin PulG